MSIMTYVVDFAHLLYSYATYAECAELVN